GGESGVGKSRLLNELRTQALVRGTLVLTGQAIQEGGGFPFQLWREPLRQALVSVAEVDDLTVSVLHPLVPDIGQLLQRDVNPAPELTGQAAQIRLFNTIATLFQKTGQPILLILEDLHWSGESLLPIPYLVRQINQQPWFIVGSYRNDERPDLPETLPNTQLMTLNRLTAEMMAQLTVAMLGEVGKQPEVLALLHRETEGNAFFAVEVIRALAEEVGRLQDIGARNLPKTLLPNGIQDVVARRLARLPEAAIQLLQLIAVAGRELEMPLVEILADDIDVDHWWLPLCAETAILEVQQGKWQFSHAKIQDGLLAQLTPQKRANQHQQVALAVETIYPDSSEQAARLAYHWGAAGNIDKEGVYAFQAGQQAASQFSTEEALAFFSQALALLGADETEKQYEILLAREVVYEISAIDREQQQEELTQLAHLAQTLDDSAKRATVAHRQAVFYGNTAQFEKALAAAQFVVQQGELAGDETLQIRGYIEWGSMANKLNRQDVARKHLEYSVKRGREIGNQKELAQALNTLGTFYSSIGQLDDEKTCLTEALSIVQQVDDVKLESILYNNLSINAYDQNVYAEAFAYEEKYLQLSQAVGDLVGEAVFYVNTGAALYRFGDYPKAFAYLKNSVLIFRQVQDYWGETLALFYLCLTADRNKKYEEAKLFVEESIASVGGVDFTNEAGERTLYLGYIYQQQGDIERSRELYAQASSMLDESRYEAKAKIQLLQAQVAADQQNWSMAASFYTAALALLDDDRTSLLRLPIQSGLATVYLAQGDKEKALDQAEPAIDHLLHAPLIDGWHDMWSALKCYDLLSEVQDLRAEKVVDRAYVTLHEKIGFIESDEAKVNRLAS
ncbi:MAG: AAA family ATPase, partial [Chloroflexota bacterium]